MELINSNFKELKWQIARTPEFLLAGRQVSALEVVKKLSPHLTEGRKARIDQVVDGRSFNIATVAEHLYDIGNISAVMRSAESFGFLPFHIVERPDAKYKMSDRISRGSEKWLDIHRQTSSEECFAGLRRQGFKIYATDLNATVGIDNIDFTQKTAVVFGNERDGITEYTRKNVDGCFVIPMYGFAQSFNISVAAALTFQIIHRQRAQKFAGGDLTPEEKLTVRAQYYLRTLDSAEKYFEER